MRQQDRPPTPEQIDIVRWTASLGAITYEALALRLCTTPASARARLTVVHRRGLLSRERPLAGRPALFTATRAGLRACGARGIDPCSVAAHGARHLMVCATAAAALERCYPDHRLVGERELRRDEREHGRPLASAQLGALHGGERRLHRPDLVLWPLREGRLPVAVEVELTVKAPRRLFEICRAWGRCRTVAGVLYLVSADVERALSRAVSETHTTERVIVVRLSALAGIPDVGGHLASGSQRLADGRDAQDI
jgi:hypothetical protein